MSEKPFNHVGRMQHYMDSISNHVNLLRQCADTMRKPDDLVESETYGEMQDAVIDIMTNVQRLYKAFLHLSNYKKD